MTLDEHYAYRRDVVDALVTDLLGPSADVEVIPDPPITQYVTGILYPRSRVAVDPKQDLGDLPADADDAAPDPAVALAHVRYPSSMGITFSIDPSSADSIVIEVTAATYQPIDVDEPGAVSGHSEPTTPAPTTRNRLADDRPWQRSPLPVFQYELDTTVPVDDRKIEVVPGLELFCRVRRPDGDATPITVALVNRNQGRAGANDVDSFFQPRIQVSAAVRGDSPFNARPELLGAGTDDELESYRLLYRHAATFAVGHGCSAEWVVDKDRPDRAISVSSTYVPKYELLLADSNPDIESPALSMTRLAQGDRDAIVTELREFVAQYERWTTTRSDEVTDLPADLADAAHRNLDACAEAAERMQQGVDLLADDGPSWTAFTLANQAMLDQRSRAVQLKAGSDTPPDNREHVWRPFQLAFILLCLEGIAKPDADSRELVDLLWFPTGGGKTEAYLGLIAYTVFRRRLIRSDGGGVTALMRYTLRLLTIQQFERAGMLICACENIRRNRNDLGTEPISIGLWVGGGATPNKRSDARRALDRLASGAPVLEGNPVQLHACLWCSTALDHRNYYLSGDNTHLVVDCRNTECEFVGGLPVHLVDEDIYDYHPTLIVATVDKFASLPWRQAASSLFNRDRPGTPPPELIVQDELHLISGPLGTLTGLYETIVDLLCREAGRPPKIVASTATIRRAGQQAKGLFARDVRQFPPPALDARNSYFAVEAPRSEKGTRMYVGLIAPGTSHTSLMVRTYAALIQTVAEHDADPKIRDPYWTLVGYFNSLRVLGGARMQVLDDVNDRTQLLANAHQTIQRHVDEPIELTSREPSANIPVYLDRMQWALPNPRAVDVILATNMISVGVDVDRLGLMAVMGQPPSTSEYIQATSRVGRRDPGLVVALYNASRSRDRSHYESFVAYHSAIYRQVEATSVTPFSTRARDRALHAVVIALARLLISEFQANDGASRVRELEPKLSIVRDAILDRVRAVDSTAVSATEHEIQEIIDDWKTRADETPDLVFSVFNDPDRSLLVDAGRDAEGGSPGIPTLWSLRDVDRTSNLFLVR